ncbi:MAG: hypothetical protein M3P30_09315 [Chloroflexota bacterium]|nr:hypothetical protein [Chloroflexota bacterium]
MHPDLMTMYLRQIWFQSEYAMIAEEELDSSDDDIVHVFYALESLLTAAANISKVLWGTYRRTALRRKPLRDLLIVAKKSPLNSTKMRNHFEHFDECIDEWWDQRLQHERFGYVDMNIGVGIDERMGRDKLWMRNWEPTSGLLWFWGQRFDVRAVLAEIHRIRNEITAQNLLNPLLTQHVTYWAHGYWEARWAKANDIPPDESSHE